MLDAYFIHFYIYLLISYAHRSNELSQIVFIQSVSMITGEILKEIDEINTTSAIENTQCTLCWISLKLDDNAGNATPTHAIQKSG